jgi:tetratricopeptide (TPR) repeat protein
MMKENPMRKVLVTFVLVLAALMMAQAVAQQPADSQANVPANQKVIKDPAEYNAYMTALNTQDPAQRAAAMDAFVKQYPQSIVRVDALEQAMAAYQQTGNQQKVQETANAILQINPNNVRALAIIVFLERQGVKDAATGAKARADAERGLQEMANWKKPEGISDADFEQLKTQMTNIFAGTAAFGALQQQDYAAASKYYEQALKVDPNDLANNYQMAISLLQANPMNPLGFWYGAKALGLAQTANPQAFQAWSPYFTSRYKKYHGNTDDWNQRIAAAAKQTAPPADFVASIPLAPTPCDLAAQAVQQNSPDSLSFSDWELVLSCRDKSPANKAAADQVWQAIQAKEKGGEAKLKIPTKVVAVPNETTLELAVSEDNQAANKADMRVNMEKPMTKPPAPGTSLDIIGVISEYTPDPFMFTMTKGELPPPAKPPVKKPPARKPGATKKKK